MQPGLRILFAFAGHEGLFQDPHFVEGDRHHGKKTQHHQGVAGEHRENKDRGDVADEPGRQEI